MKTIQILILSCFILAISSCGAEVEEALSKEDAKTYQEFIKKTMDDRNVAYRKFIDVVTPVTQEVVNDPNYEIDFGYLEELLSNAKAANEKATADVNKLEEVKSKLAYKPTLLKLLDATQGFLVAFENFFEMLKKEQTEETVKNGYAKVHDAGAVLQEQQKEMQAAQRKFISKYKLDVE